MIISYNWLQSYFKEELPSPEKVAELLIFHAFEVESVEKKGNDTIFDVKVLPDRAHDALSHRGIARELATHLRIHIVVSKKSKFQGESPHRTLSIDVQDQTLCRRYTGRVIEGVKVRLSPQWLVERLEAIGQKSINNIVDATNFIMFDLGQPTHAFDADKVEGGVTVRYAKKGENVTTLDGKEVELDDQTLIITDEKSPLAIAGIKGGKRAEINTDTTNLILEVANFSPTNIRKTSRRLGIQTDSSKRFENERSSEGAEEAMEAITALIVEIAGGENTSVGDIIDVYPRKPAPYVVGVATNEVNRILGTNISEKEIGAIFTRGGFTHRIAHSPVEEILGRATALLDTPYVYGASIVYDAPRAFDCSSFIAYLFAQSGVAIPRMAVDQYAYGDLVVENDMKPGDLVFSNTGTGKIYYETVEFMKGKKIQEGVDHCGLYAGDGNVIHATRVTGKVVVENLAQSPQFKNVVGYRRIHEATSPRFVVTISHDRIDIRIKEDLVDEIGKIYGYDKIVPRELPQFDKNPAVNKEFFYTQMIRNILMEEGFSEIYTSSFRNRGDIAVENPIASDKSFLRSDLFDALQQGIATNVHNAPLLQSDAIKVFEIGKVFAKNNEERTHIAIGIKYTPGYKGDTAFNAIEKVYSTLSEKLGHNVPGGNKYSKNEAIGESEAIAEIDFDELLSILPEPRSYEDVLEISKRKVFYKKISSYPFVLRDVAVFLPSKTEEEDVVKVIKHNSGVLLVRDPKLFDRFEKKNKETGEVEKISYAFSLVFQSQEKTLSDDEVNVIMGHITEALNKNSGWKVR